MSEAVQAVMAALEAPTPWITTGDGCIHDRNGHHVVQVDVNAERTDECAIVLARLLVLLVNGAAGYTEGPRP
jgi:hypothetical protein